MIINYTAISSDVIKPEISSPSSSYSSSSSSCSSSCSSCSSSSSSSISLSPFQASGCVSHFRNAFLSFASLVISCKVSCNVQGKEF
jgi:hypothetical protein